MLLVQSLKRNAALWNSCWTFNLQKIINLCYSKPGFAVICNSSNRKLTRSGDQRWSGVREEEKLFYHCWCSLPHSGNTWLRRKSKYLHRSFFRSHLPERIDIPIFLHSFCPGVEYPLGWTLRTDFSLYTRLPSKMCWMNKWTWSTQDLGEIVILLF